MNTGELAAAVREEAEFWLDTPGGTDPNATAYMLVPMLLRLADRIEAIK